MDQHLRRSSLEDCEENSHVRIRSYPTLQGPVVRRPISANPELNFNLGFYISLFKGRLRILFPICFWSVQSSNGGQKELSWIFSFQAFRPYIKFMPALNTQSSKTRSKTFTNTDYWRWIWINLYRSIQVGNNTNRPFGLSKGWPRPLNRGDRLIGVKITVIKGIKISGLWKPTA